MKSVKSLRLPEQLLRAARFRARKEHVDESDALRHLLALGVVEYAARLYERGEVTLREAARLAGLGLWDMLDETWKRGIRGNLTAEDAQDTMDSTLETYERLKSGRGIDLPEWVARDIGKDGYRRSRAVRSSVRKKRK